MTSRTMRAAPAQGAPPSRVRRLLPLAYGLAAALTAGVLWFAIGRPVQVIPRIRPAPAFTLSEPGGSWYGTRELRGRVSLVSFGYARCGAACAASESRMGAVRDALAGAGLLGGQAALVTIGVDTEHDDAAALRGYAARLGADGDAWRVLSGGALEVKTVVGAGFGVYYGPAEPGAGAPLELEQLTVLVDGGGTIRAEYRPSELDPQRVLRDIGLIQREAAGSAWERPIYDAAHLFVCYPQ